MRNLNYAEVRKQIQTLGYADLQDMTEFEDNVVNAVNLATRLISLTVRPIKRNFVVRLTDIDDEGNPVYPKGEDGYITIDMTEHVDDFMGWDGNPYYLNADGRNFINDYFIKDETKIALRGDLPYYMLTIPYKKEPTPITGDTADDFEMEIDKILHPLLPLLATYYVWLDDDSTKATSYYNQYDDMKNQILANNTLKPTLKFNGGVKWHR